MQPQFLINLIDFSSSIEENRAINLDFPSSHGMQTLYIPKICFHMTQRLVSYKYNLLKAFLWRELRPKRACDWFHSSHRKEGRAGRESLGLEKLGDGGPSILAQSLGLMKLTQQVSTLFCQSWSLVGLRPPYPCLHRSQQLLLGDTKLQAGQRQCDGCRQQRSAAFRLMF